jgi:hypothetical protein
MCGRFNVGPNATRRRAMTGLSTGVWVGDRQGGRRRNSRSGCSGLHGDEARLARVWCGRRRGVQRIARSVHAGRCGACCCTRTGRATHGSKSARDRPDRHAGRCDERDTRCCWPRKKERRRRSRPLGEVIVSIAPHTDRGAIISTGARAFPSGCSAPAGSPEPGDHRLFVEPCRSVGPSADVLADQAVDTRYPNVIGLGGEHL